jgi:hypothetical protein
MIWSRAEATRVGVRGAARPGVQDGPGIQAGSSNWGCWKLVQVRPKGIQRQEAQRSFSQDISQWVMEHA